MSAPDSQGRRWLYGVGRWAPSSQVLSLWALWWIWRYGAVSSLPGFDETTGAVALGFLVDALALDGLMAACRWRQGDQRARGQTSTWVVHIAGWLLVAAALLRAVDGLHCYLGQRHVDAAFWSTLSDHLWGLRYVLVAAVATGFAGRWLVRQELRRTARLMTLLDDDQRGRWVHVDALRAALGLVVAAWLSVSMSSGAAQWVSPSEWWALSSLFGG